MPLPYHDLDDKRFEALTHAICIKLLGVGVQPFSSGPDGGRDARFHGTAERFPSQQEPLRGKFVVQAKHTEHPYAKFSDASFSSDADSSVLSEEIPRIRRLVEAEELDHYLLFSNRRLGGEIDAQIRGRIIGECGVETVELFSVERIDLLLKVFPDIHELVDLSELDSPLRVTPDDLATVILALREHGDVFEAARRPIDQVVRETFERKNEVNGLSREFAKMIVKDYMPYFQEVKDFLANPANASVLERYEESCAEFQDQLIANHDGIPLDQLLVNMQRLLWQRDGDLGRNKRATKLIIYYMYWNCDIGAEEERDDQAD